MKASKWLSNKQPCYKKKPPKKPTAAVKFRIKKTKNNQV